MVLAVPSVVHVHTREAVLKLKHVLCFCVAICLDVSIVGTPTVTSFKLPGFGRGLCGSHSGGCADVEHALHFCIAICLDVPIVGA